MTYYLQTHNYVSESSQTTLGTGLSIKGDTIVATGTGEDKKVYFFKIINDLLVRQLIIDTTEQIRTCCLSGDGNTLVLSSPTATLLENRIVVYDKVGSSWVKRAITITSPDAYGYFGWCVATNYDASLIVVGTWQSPTYSGRIHTFAISGTTATELDLLLPPTGYSDVQFGMSIALNSAGNLLMVGSPRKSAALSMQGDVTFFFFDGQKWTSKDSRPPLYSPIPGITYNFGSSIYLSEDEQTLLVGENVYVYRFTYRNSDFTWIPDSVSLNQNMAGAAIAFCTIGEFNYIILGLPFSQGRLSLYKQVRRFVAGIVRQNGVGVIRTVYITPKDSFTPSITLSTKSDGTWFQPLNMSFTDTSMINVIVKAADSSNNDVLYKLIPSWEY